MKNKISGFGLGLLFLLTALLTGCISGFSPLKIPAHQSAIKQEGPGGPDLPYWIDIAAFTPRLYFLTNGREIYLWEPARNSYRKLSRPDDLVWEPAGLVYDPRQEILWVANGEAHNILGFKVDLLNEDLILEKKLFHPLMVDPRNLALSPDGEYLAAADFEGSALLCFDRRGDFVWRLPIFSAGGVASGDKYFYVASLERRQIKKVDYQGDIVDCIGKPGWGADQYLLPGSLSASSRGLLIADSHTGKLTFTNPELENERAIGKGNGPGADLLNFPRRAIWDKDGNCLALDTFNRRILKLTPHGEVLKQYGFAKIPVRGRDFSPLTGSLTFPNYIFPRQPLEELKTAFPLAFKKKNYHYALGFESLDVYGGNRELIAQLKVNCPPSVMTRFISPEAYYPFSLTWALPVNEYRIPFIVVGSPQSPYLIAIDTQEGAFAFQTCPPDLYALWYYHLDRKVHRADGKAVNLVKVCYPFLNRADYFHRLLLRGESRPRAFKRAFYPDLSVEEFFSRLDELMPSPEGKDFLAAVKNRRSLEKAGRDYFSSTQNQPTRFLLEICLVKALSGPTSWDSSK